MEITPGDSKSNRDGHQVELAVGEARITVTVSEDQGAGSTTHTLLVTREPAPQKIRRRKTRRRRTRRQRTMSQTSAGKMRRTG